MEFRPCIDIHNGIVKQIVGGTLTDEYDGAEENYVCDQDAAYYANLYKRYGLQGGHVIVLNAIDSEFYEKTRLEAFRALEAFPSGLQVGGGITAETAPAYIRAGATHVIVTSYVFKNGEIRYDRLNELVRAVGHKHIVLDLSCKKRAGRNHQIEYVVMTDRWQKETKTVLSRELLEELSDFCDEFLIHATDVEGKCNGIEEELVSMLGTFSKRAVTYAGGIRNIEDIELIKKLGNGHVNFTVGSALDLFGGDLPFREICNFKRESFY